MAIEQIFEVSWIVSGSEFVRSRKLDFREWEEWRFQSRDLAQMDFHDTKILQIERTNGLVRLYMDECTVTTENESNHHPHGMTCSPVLVELTEATRETLHFEGDSHLGPAPEGMEVTDIWSFRELESLEGARAFEISGQTDSEDGEESFDLIWVVHAGSFRACWEEFTRRAWWDRA